MSQYSIAVLVGSLRKESLNAKLAAALARPAPPEFSFQRVQIGDLPVQDTRVSRSVSAAPSLRT